MKSMAVVTRPAAGRWLTSLFALASFAALPILALAQSNQSQSQPQQSGSQTQQQPSQSKPAQDLPDDPSVVQPPPKPTLPVPPPSANRSNEPIPFPGDENKTNQGQTGQGQGEDAQQPTPAMPPIETLPPGTPPLPPRNQISPDSIYTLTVRVNFVALPVMVTDSQGRRVDGLLPKDFTVLENNKPQKLSYFTSDPFQLSVAVLLDTGMADVSLQRINQTYSALVGAFSPFDEVALYTYSSTVTQVTDFTSRPERLTAKLDELKLVRGRNNGPPVLGGPLGPQGPMVNGVPVGSMSPASVETPPRESRVLNDAILRAALDLSRRDKTRRKVIFVISDGRELGSRASYKAVLRVLQTRDIQVRAVVVDSGALPGFRQVGKLHLPLQGYSNLLTKYVYATCGDQDLARLSRNGIEDAYASIASAARNQYTLGYSPAPTTGSSAYRSVEVLVHRKGLNVKAKAGYYPSPGQPSTPPPPASAAPTQSSTPAPQQGTAPPQ